jgi:hypothetical protein
MVGFRHFGSDNIQRSKFIPPKELTRMIFPFVESIEDQLNCNRLPSKITNVTFLKLLRWFCQVILQDAPFSRKLCPRYMIFSHPVFASSEYVDFEKLLLSDPTTDQTDVEQNYLVNEVRIEKIH